jgi:hypothetical protein
MAEKKNTNKLIIEGDYDKLVAIQQMAASRLGTNSLKFSFADIDEKERERLTVPETQENKTDRLRRVIESGGNAQMAPNLVDHDALPNDNLDKLSRAGLYMDDGYKERKQQAHEENEEQVKRLEKKIDEEPNRAANLSSAANPSNRGGSPSKSDSKRKGSKSKE